MATKTVINTITATTTISNMPMQQQPPTSRGISIIIDQDQLQPQQVVNCKQQQQLEAAKITIYQNNSHCNVPATTRTEISRVQQNQPQYQQVSPNATTTQILKTFIDINRNNNNDVVSAGAAGACAVADNDVVVVANVDKKKCGEFLYADGGNTATFIRETGYTTTTFPQLLLLKVASSNGDSNTSNKNLDNNNKNEPLTTTSERGKFTAKVVVEKVAVAAKEDIVKEVAVVVGGGACGVGTEEKAKEVNLLLVGKSQVNKNANAVAVDVAGNGVSNGCAGISITHEYGESNSSNGINIGNNDEFANKQQKQQQTNQSNKMMIIQCNNNNNNNANSNTNETKYLNNDVVEYNNNYDNDVNGNDEEQVDNDQTKHNEESHRRGRLHFNGISANSFNSSGGGVGIGNGENGQNTFGQQQTQQSQLKQLENVYATNAHSSLTTKAVDCASALTETVRNADSTKINSTTADSSSSTATAATNTANSISTHVVKIQIKPNASGSVKEIEKQVTVVKLNNSKNNTNALNKESSALVAKTDLHLNLNNNNKIETEQRSEVIDKMVVQKSNANVLNLASPNGQNSNSGGVGGSGSGVIHSGNTTVTELNVSHPSYLYYMMSSGQFSPCDTLDSGTGSDLESNGQTPSPKIIQTNGNNVNGNANNNNSNNNANSNGGGAPKLEMHLKTTKIRVSGKKSLDKIQHNNSNAEQHTARAGSLTDSEESESSSSLSCDSLHSNEFMRQSSISPNTINNNKNTIISTTNNIPIPPPPLSPSSATMSTSAKMFKGSFLPDSLLREICDRKFPTNDFTSKYDSGNDHTPETESPESINEQDYIVEQHTKFLQERNSTNSSSSKRASLPSKTFVLNAEDGTFFDTKMNSMPRKYEADKFYNFHVNEHENFRSFGNGGGGEGSTTDDLESLSEYDTKSLQDDAFAGYKDIRCGSATSTIRSSKGTVRGVKNRVRNGIATFLQLQQPNVKNYKEKDLGKVVLYTTSMGIIRDTYAKCSNLKKILRTLLVKFEERDVFMSVEYQQEIKERMHSEAIKVPQLYVEGQHIGDAETVERLNESGELRQLLKPYKSISTTYTCQTCGGYRLLPCPSCKGSKKSVHRNHFTAEFVALKCMNCDEVGLVKCHNC